MLPTWNETGVALANHLWQSTVFAVVVGAMTVLLRRNSAVIRYRLWLIASIKFLLPFSLFVAVGSVVQWRPVRSITVSEVPAVVRQLSQPFTPVPIMIRPTPSPKAAPVAPASFGVVLVSVWFAGAFIVLFLWFVRWFQLVRIVGRCEPLTVPAQLDSLPIRVLSSSAATEPGVFGIVRPALLLPLNISRTLSTAQLRAVIAHEMFHVSGRDNLASAMHTVVEALFWFHPLVWWLGNRLVDERERACDEAVLQSGHDPLDYAEGILKVCRSNVMTPACLAGVSGSNIRKRIEVIMENRGTLRLSHGKKLLLVIAGAVVLVGPVLAGMMKAAQSPVSAVRETQLAASSQVPAQLAPLPAVQAETRTIGVPAGASAIGGSFVGLNYSTNNFVGFGETISPAVQAGAQQSNFVVSLTEPYFQDPQAALQQATASIQQSSEQVVGQPVIGVLQWLDNVSLIITDAERKAFQQLTNDRERQGFITNFWLVRDPTPGTPANEFKEEFDRRVAYANEHFSTQSGIPGSKTDRGKMYILNGAPDEIVSHPNGGTYYRPAEQRGGTVNTFPFETWRYLHLDGKSQTDNVVYEFVDRQMNGEYTLEYDPAAKDRSDVVIPGRRSFTFSIGRTF